MVQHHHAYTYMYATSFSIKTHFNLVQVHLNIFINLNKNICMYSNKLGTFYLL